MGLSQVKQINSFVKKRNSIANFYDKNIETGLGCYRFEVQTFFDPAWPSMETVTTRTNERINAKVMPMVIIQPKSITGRIPLTINEINATIVVIAV